MIPATRPYEARFETEDGTDNYVQPVIAWDSEGYALVVNHSQGWLTRATDIPNFRGLVEKNGRPAPRGSSSQVSGF